MSLTFTIKVQADETFGLLEGMEAALRGGLGKDWAGPAVSNEIAAIAAEKFETGGGGLWPSLAPSTVEARARGWGYYSREPAAGVSASSPILVWTSTLRDSVVDPRGAGAEDAVIRMHADVLEQGTRVPYFVYHTETRNPYAFEPADQRRIIDVVREFFDGFGGGES